MRGLRAGAALLLASFLLAAPAARARVNLPQIRHVVALLLRPLPRDFRESCGAMFQHWGEIARGSAEWKVRVLHQEADRIWPAFRCWSRTPEYADVYDERPAVLRLETGKLESFPLAPDSDNDSTLYHLEFSQTVPLEGARGLAFKATEPPENPCCDGPESRSGETWRIFAETPRGVAEVLSIVTVRDDSSHSHDPEIDSETTYRARITMERGPQGTVREVVTTFTEEEKEITWEGGKAVERIVGKRSGTLGYRWNPAKQVFEDVK